MSVAHRAIPGIVSYCQYYDPEMYNYQVSKELGIEIAKAATGHAHISTTQIYAERDLDAAKKVALRFG